MNETIFFHHYTDINTLALILENQKLRFNRLDHVDDLIESTKYGKYHLSQYLFVSCWTDSEEESLPLWAMYSKAKSGVIISLPKDPFLYKQLKPHPRLAIQIEGDVLSFLPIEELFTDNYMVNAVYINKDNFIKKVEYVDDTILKDLRGKAVNLNMFPNNQFKLEIAGPTQLAGYKLNFWSFQSEVRYIIMVYPCPPLPKDISQTSKWNQEMAEYVLDGIKKEKDIGLQYIDINLDPKSINQIGVTLSPYASESEKIIVDSLLEKYTSGGKSFSSNLSTKIRNNKS